jgi:manganese transport protein
MADLYDPYALPNDAIQEPPTSLWRALRKIGPGIILAGSIVGSGELIQTTKLGAQFGFAFLWLILFSCVIKVFVQIELGRYAISSGKPTLGALNELPGPRLGAHWLVWWWFFMLLCTVFQLGGMVGGVGQALDLAFPRVSPAIADALSSIWPALGGIVRADPAHPWAVLTALAAVALLLSGGYKRIELLTTILVAGVTLVTVTCVIALPASGNPIDGRAVLAGVSTDIVGSLTVGAAGIAAAFSTFGITGVGASELYSYPYWCLEKGYARFAGRNAPDDDWVRRARGWMRVLHLDAWASMVVFTLATVAFYFMGAVVLHSRGEVPDGKTMVASLSQMYLVFGDWTRLAFLIGVWAVLFKTLYVASAGHSRLTADFFSLAGFVKYPDAAARARWIRGFCVFYPLLALALYFTLKNPVTLVLIGGFAQGATLPVISAAAVYLRYRRTDRRIAPSPVSDFFLWTALISISVGSAYAILPPLLKPIIEFVR